LLLYNSRLLLLLLQGLQALGGLLLGLFPGPMDLLLQGLRLLEGPLLGLLLGPMVHLHKALMDPGLLHYQVLHHPNPVLVAELELLVALLLSPAPPLDLLPDLQGEPQEACSLTHNLALFPVQGATSPMTC